MEEYVPGELVYRTPTCTHLFHDECMRSWLMSRNQEREQRCPLCNVKLDITILRDLRREREKKELENEKKKKKLAGSASKDSRKISHISPNTTDDKLMIKEIRDISTLEYNPGCPEYNPDIELEQYEKFDKTNFDVLKRDSITGSLNQIQS